ncbi:hypothetical protein EW145_g2693 [Phellinidium pouzarii]|uniref:AA9 family lytic polysaccharide monooxygenase n=1 Tax=Phellinidium pouzarii TaxID=167371 RepID=A0A4V6S188_9AGAM|nr:hypothetical protein EW145_g2693 [Phellinidium pouzarii]
MHIRSKNSFKFVSDFYLFLYPPPILAVRLPTYTAFYIFRVGSDLSFSALQRSLLFALAQLAIRVSAHGGPRYVSIDGTTYEGANGVSASSNSAVRKVSTGDPVTDVTSNNLICGQNAQTAPNVATAKPGSFLQFYWENEGSGNWVHNTGPIMTYMASCSGDCTLFIPDSSTEWFKIEEDGEAQSGASGTWAQAAITTGAPANVTIPSGLAAGNYLVRHELIALQNSQSIGGAEFYPSCLQLTVTGNDSGKPNTTVHFPGAYTANDPGILGNFYNPDVVYVFPGGPIVSISDSGSSGSSSSSVSSSSHSGRASTTAADTSGFASPTATLVSASSTASAANVQCSISKKRKLRRRSTGANSNDTTSAVKKRRAIGFHHKRRSADYY